MFAASVVNSRPHLTPPHPRSFMAPTANVLGAREQLSRSAKVVHRGFAVELSSRLLAEAWTWANNNDSGNGDVATPGASPSPSPGLAFVDAGGKAMLGLVVARAADTAPTVRRG